MTIIKFMDKLYEVVPDEELNRVIGSPCDHCCFQKDQNHKCNAEDRMRHMDGSKVQGCVEGKHLYRAL